jgi:hypothetical protein
LASATVCGQSNVGLYERFEAEIRNGKSYQDPFRDVTLETVFRGPDGSETRFWGFYNGGSTWRLRFMPWHEGEWTWEARFSDGTAGGSGSFRCTGESVIAGKLDRYPWNPIWFGYSSGAPELIRGLHLGDRFFARNWPDAERKKLLDWVQANDYNLLSIASHYLNRSEPGRGEGWETPDLWPLNPGEYHRMEGVLDDLARRQILVFPFAGFFGQDSDYPREPADQAVYIRYTLARLGAYWNVLFNVAGPEPNLRGGRRWMSDEEVTRLGRLIAKLDVFRHPVAVHNRTGDDPFRDSDWSTYGVIQGPKTSDLAKLSAGLLESHHPEKPLLAQETLWSGNVNHIRALGGRDYTDDELRTNAIVIQMSAAAIVFADNDGNSSTGFSGTLDPEAAKQRRHEILRKVWDFFETTPFYRMSPAQDLVDRGFCLAEAGREYLVYLPEGGTVNVTVKEGPYRVVWVNARKTEETREAGPTADGRGLKAPDGQDWFLRLVP